MLINVDDIQLFGTPAGIQELSPVLKSAFMMKWLGRLGEHLYLGLHFIRDCQAKQILVGQPQYASQILEGFGMTTCDGCYIPMDPEEDWSIRQDDTGLSDDARRLYQTAIRSLLYLMLGSRLDFAFAVTKLRQYCSSPTKQHWTGIKRVLRFVKATLNTYLVLSQRASTSTAHKSLVYGFFDAAYMNDTTDRHSTMAYVFFVGNSVVSWSSKKQASLALSTNEAEYLSGTEAIKDALWIKAFLTSVGIPSEQLTSIQLMGDNAGANALSRNPEYHSCTKHIHGRQCFITEMVEAGYIQVLYVATANMVANSITKPLPRTAFCRFMDMLGLKPMYLGEGLYVLQGQFSLRCRRCGLHFFSRNALHRHL